MTQALNGRRVLVVEDESLVAMLLETILEDMGCTPVGPASNIDDGETMARDTADLVERDAIIVTDTSPAEPSELRRSLRPRGFSLVILDKDGKTALRKPLPWDTREITHAIDKFPSRIIEVQERNPSGR